MTRGWAKGLLMWAVVLAGVFVPGAILHAQAPTRGAEIKGRVTGAPTGDTIPLPHAVIEVLSARPRVTTADGRGRYALTDVRGGEARIRVTHSGHDPLELTVVVPDEGTLLLDLHLSGAPVDLGEIHVEGEQEAPAAEDPARSAPGEPPSGVAHLDAEALLTTSGITELGLAEAARRGSGNDPPDPTALLFMRGSTADLKLVLLDGAPIHTPFHLGGLMDPIQPTTVGRTRLFLGGAPARYNGGLSHILDIETKRPRVGPVTGQVAADLMGISASAEGGAGPFALLASGRSLHGLANSLLADGQQPYGYEDGLLRGELDVGGGRLSVTAFRNRESVNLDPILGLQDRGFTADASQGSLSLTESDAAWSNAVVSARYGFDVGDWTVESTAAWSSYDAQLPVGDTTLTILGGSSTKRHVEVDAERPTAWGSASAGLSYEEITVRESADEIVGPLSQLTAKTMEGRVVGAYVEASRNLSGVTVRGGLRGDAFEGAQSLEISPRLSLLWPMSETALFRLAVGRYSQLARRSDPAVPSELGIQSPGFQGEPLLGIATATHLVASIDQRLTPQVTVGLEGFVKSFDDLPDAGGGKVNASGMDLRIARSHGANRGWLGYGLTWFWSDTGTLSDAQFSGHHLLTAGLSGPFGRIFNGVVRLSYGSGLPFSSVPFGARDALEADAPTGAPGGLETASAGSRVPVPDESFLRLDLTVSGRWTVAESPGRQWVLSPYLRVLNALDRRDSLFYYFEPWRADSPRPLTELPVLPVLGLSLSF